MSVNLQLSSVSQLPVATIHKLPCSISHQGDAKISDYFETSIREDETGDTSKTATFRGRLLNGCEMKVPKGYKGIIMKENRKPFDEDEERTFKVTHSFDKMTSWNLDRKCSVSDRIQQASDWISVAKMIHLDNEEKENNESTANSST